MIEDAINSYQFSLVLADGNQIETIRYRLPSLREIPDYIARQGDDSDIVAWLCGESIEWTDRFEPQSLIALAEQIEERMGPPVAAWTARQVAKGKRVRAAVESLRAAMPSDGARSSRTSPSSSAGTSGA